MNVLCNLEPKSVFRFFEDLRAIPHGSRNTKAISDYCVAFAKERGLERYQDQDNNIITIKEATAGYENAPAIILQGHLDMVCEKEHDCTQGYGQGRSGPDGGGRFCHRQGHHPGRR